MTNGRRANGEQNNINGAPCQGLQTEKLSITRIERLFPLKK